MKIRNSILVLLILSLALIIVSCEELQELFTSVSGNIQNNGSSVSDAIVIAINGNLEAYSALEDIEQEGLDESSLNSITDIVKGFDPSSESNGDYTATLLSGGDILVIAVSDENDNQELDSLDLVGWYGDVVTEKFPDPYGTPPDSMVITFTIPDTISISTGDDITGIDIESMIEYWKISFIQQYIK